MTSPFFVLNPEAVKELKKKSPCDHSGWLLRVVPNKSQSRVATVVECWCHLTGNLLFFCDDPNSDPKSVLILENHCVELFDSFEQYELAFGAKIKQSSAHPQGINSLTEYFDYLNIYHSQGRHLPILV